MELRNEFNSVLNRTRTDGSGRFSFLGLSSGRFSIKVLPLGTDFEEQTQDIEISGIEARGRPIPENVQLDFYLRLRKNPTPAVNRVLFAQEIPEEAKKLYENAVSDLDRQKTAEGMQALETAIGLFPGYFLALERLGIECLKIQKYAEADKYFSTAVKVNSRSFISWYGLAYANFSLNKPESVIDAAGNALILDPRSVNTLFFLGVSQRHLKMYVAAERSLLQAKKLDGDKTPDIYWNLALLYAHNLKRYKDAAIELEVYLKAKPHAKNAALVRRLIQEFRDKDSK
ncbi:MAG: tetratricopeptide repeat protein [Saprospiraceae bacterium]|nr:tetratricopeptide repeat protein [Pyrinomonadaceae bacterium]